MTFFAMSLLLVPIQFMLTENLYLLLIIGAVMGFFTSGQYTWMSSWAPELSRRAYGQPRQVPSSTARNSLRPSVRSFLGLWS